MDEFCKVFTVFSMVFLVLIVGYAVGFSSGYTKARVDFIESPSRFALYTLDWVASLGSGSQKFYGLEEVKEIAGTR